MRATGQRGRRGSSVPHLLWRVSLPEARPRRLVLRRVRGLVLAGKEEGVQAVLRRTGGKVRGNRGSGSGIAALSLIVPSTLFKDVPEEPGGGKTR